MEQSHNIRFTSDHYKHLLFFGDAGHAFGPMLQNRAAQAFEDAYVVQDFLAQKMILITFLTRLKTGAKKGFRRSLIYKSKD